jgi:hypothetical protein
MTLPSTEADMKTDLLWLLRSRCLLSVWRQFVNTAYLWKRIKCQALQRLDGYQLLFGDININPLKMKRICVI